MHALLETDEETDAGAFTAYLRAQSDADLLDIGVHLDAARYPARVDAVRREVSRRRVLPITVHTSEERFMRGLALAALLFAGVTVLLTLSLGPDDALGRGSVNFDAIPDGTPVSALMRPALLGLLRILFADGVQGAVAPLTALTLAGWLLTRTGNPAIRTDVKGLVLVALTALVGSFLLAAAPFSSVPPLFDASFGGDFWARLARLLRPF